ncbi:MAG: hypothetical protein A2147_05215 [Chloroflexi bacterium RBG_16_57_8]|nr:MAG: hypothetical protein A2147_05215 [Chloroflexi bacterium RBG_16_57_8]
MGDAYDIMPEAATLDQAAGLAVTYDPALVPGGVAEDALAIAAWERRTGDWAVVAGSAVNASTHSVFAPLDRFGRYAVVAPVGAATFAVKDLEISPNELRPGGKATAAVMVTNNGARTGSYTVVLKVDGSAISTREVTLAGGASERVEFSVPGNAPGSFAVSVENLSATLTVGAAPAFATSPSTSSSNRSAVFGTIPALISAAALVAVLILMVLRRKESSRTRAAAFAVKDLEISPKELRLGGKATVAVTVANKGDRAGSFRVTLKINGSVGGAKDVTLAGGTSDRVQFSVPGSSAGSFAVTVEDLSDTFTVVEGPAPNSLTYQSI